MTVTQKEIVDALNTACKIITDAKGVPAVIAYIEELASRIEREGIAPPDGWGLVPIEPTKRMLMCFKHEWITNQANECYEMLLAVAPKPEVKP